MQLRYVVLIFISLSFSFIAHAQKFAITGTVQDSATKLALEEVLVELEGTSYFASTNQQGEFIILDVPPGDYKLILEGTEYVSLSMQISVQNEDVALGNIDIIRQRLNNSSDIEFEIIPTVIIADQEIDGAAASSATSQNISSVLNSSRDIFLSAAAFNFRAGRFRIRGYDSKHNTVLFNGVPVNDLESGRAFWSLWGGLNDVTRNQSIVQGLGAASFTFGGVGGATALDTRASRQREQLRVSYALSNQIYRNRVMATYSSGMNEKGWAFSVSGSRRWADEGYIEGTFYDGYSYFLSVDKKLGDKHILNLTGFNAPLRRGRSTGAIQLLYDLAGSNYYNPNWGYQNGEKRNSRTVDANQPAAFLRHDWEMSENTKLTTGVGFITGRYATTAFDWFGTDPRPDYYRRLPNAIDNIQAEAVADLLSENPGLLQVQWDDIIDNNRNYFRTIENADGIEGNSVSGNRALVILEERRNDRDKLSFYTNFEHRFNQKLALYAGVGYDWQKSRNYKVVHDLLGADFYVDIDDFEDVGTDAEQTNIDTPNGIITEDEVFGYDYDFNTNRASGWVLADWRLRKFDMFIGGNAGSKTFWREGNIRNGIQPDQSFGTSDKADFLEYGVKAGITYKINGRNYLILNASYNETAPNVRDAFRAERQWNALVPDLTTEKITSIEGGYLLKSPYAKARIFGYYTLFQDQLFNRSLFLDSDDNREGGLTSEFIQYVLSGIETEHMGLELAAEVRVLPGLNLRAAAALGQYIYKNRPNRDIYSANDDIQASIDASEISDTPVYIENFYVTNSPQSAYTLGLSYNSPKYWFANLNLNYFDDIFIDFYPERRTAAAIQYTSDPQYQQEIVEPDSDLWNQILHQEQVDAQFTLDFFGGKSFKINNFFLYLNVGVSNILDNQDFITGGFEPFRFDFNEKNVDRFANRYFYSFGRTYFINLTFRL